MPKNQELESMNEYVMQQQRKLENLREALKESREQRQATSIAYMEISQKLTNSIPLTPGPNVNKPRIPRPQDTVYQKAVVQAKERDENEDENASATGEIEIAMLKTFSNLTNVLKNTSKYV
jgi:hypothetical protein